MSIDHARTNDDESIIMFIIREKLISEWLVIRKLLEYIVSNIYFSQTFDNM